MAASSERLLAQGAGVASRTHPLSQGIVAGIAAILDFGVSALTGLAVYFAYVAPVVEGKLALYCTAIALFSLLLVQSLYAAGLYRFHVLMAPARHIGQFLAVFSILFLAFVAGGFALKISAEFSRVWAFGWLVLALACGVAARFAVAELVRAGALAGRIRRNIVIYGAGSQAERLIEHIERLREPWNTIVGVFDDRLARVGPTVGSHPVLGNVEDLIAWARRHRADEVLIALPWSAGERLLAIMRRISVLPTNVRLSPEFIGLDRLHRRVSHQFDVPMLNVMEKPISSWGALTKAVMDRVLGVVFLALALPVMAIAALAIRLESPGPVLFRQQRYGFNNQLICIYKLRTMYADRLDAHAESLTRRDDPRVTRVGAFLRRWSIDELPQLFNVLTGEMSVVGPRPHALRAKAGGKLYEDVIDEYATRHRVKPGITGWAQVNGWRGSTETEEDLVGRVDHDIYYIENWSVLLDLSIILRTVLICLRGTNSY
jgi:Undecaprenyl-phosphate glucose phosphotransferase